MSNDADDDFFTRADAVIKVANDQADATAAEQVSASLMYATARYNAFVGAGRAESSEDLASGKDKILEYFVDQYRMMLDENLDDYIRNFDKYISVPD